MDKNDLTPQLVLPGFLILCMFVFMIWRGEVAPPSPGLYLPTPEVVCECDRDHYDCGDFRSRRDAQQCHDYCQWLSQSHDDVHHLDSDGDGIVCEPTPVPGSEHVLRWVTQFFAAIVRTADDPGRKGGIRIINS